MSALTKEEIQKNFGSRLKALREGKGLTKTALADLIDMERQHIREMEIGKRNPTLFNLVKIALALNISLPDLLNIEIYKKK